MDAFGQHGTARETVYGHLQALRDAEQITLQLRAETGLGRLAVEIYERPHAGHPVWCIRAGDPHRAAIVVALVPDRRALTPQGRARRRLAWVWDAPTARGPISRIDMTMTRAFADETGPVVAILRTLADCLPEAAPPLGAG